VKVINIWTWRYEKVMTLIEDLCLTKVQSAKGSKVPATFEISLSPFSLAICEV